MARLGDVVRIEASSQKSVGDRFWLLNLDMVEQQTGNIIDYNYVGKDALNGSIIQFDTGCVLYSKLRPNLNKVVIPNQDGFATSEMLPLRPNTKLLTREYLTVFLRSDSFVTWAVSKTAGAKMPRLGSKELLGKEIPLPSISEQIRIAGQFAKVDELISLRKEQLAKLDQLVKSRFIELFGDTIINPFNWEKNSLGIVCDVRDGTHDSPQYYETGYPLVTSKNVTGGKIDLTDCSLICETDFKKINERSKVDIGDIIMPMIGTVGKPVIVDIEPNFAIKNVSLIKFKVDSRVLNIYIRALLQSDYFDDAVLSKVRGGTQKFISLGDIRKLEVLVPPMELQKQFADFVEQTDKSKFEIQKSLEKLETLKNSLMQKYFG